MEFAGLPWDFARASASRKTGFGSSLLSNGSQR